MESKDGGPAFPTPGFEDMRTDPPTLGLPRNRFPGMSRRDYFAAAALTGIIMRSTNDATAVIPRASNGAIIDRSRYADTAFQYADAMIEAERGTSK